MGLATRAVALPLATAIALGTLSPAWAGRVRYVSATAAEEGSVSISVHIEGGGVLLDFSATEEQIKQISIDDASRVVVDHCLVTKTCDGQPSPIIRLFRSKGVKFPDIPVAKTTLLSVQTVDSQGAYHSYPFQITTPNNGSSISKIVIGGNLDESLAKRGRYTNNPTTPATVALGAREAESKSLLVDPQLKGRIRNYLQLLQGGMSSQKAAQTAGISQSLVARLEQLGQDRAAKAKQTVAATPPLAQPPSALTPPPSQPKSNKTHIASNVTVAIPPKPSSIAAVPKVQERAPTNPNYKPNENQLQANALVRGLSIAKCQKKISPRVAARVQDVIYNLRKGEAIAAAAKRSGVPMQMIDQLLVLSRSGG